MFARCDVSGPDADHRSGVDDEQIQRHVLSRTYIVVLQAIARQQISGLTGAEKVIAAHGCRTLPLGTGARCKFFSTAPDTEIPE
jgi:hypothetical protein